MGVQCDVGVGVCRVTGVWIREVCLGCVQFRYV